MPSTRWGSSAEESARLQRQAEELAPDSAVLLQTGSARGPGQAAIDLGCGPPGILGLTWPAGRHPAAGSPRRSLTPNMPCAIRLTLAFDRICEIFPVAFSRNGADPAIGRRVSELFREAGLTDVGVESRTQMYPPGNSRRTIPPDLVRCKHRWRSARAGTGGREGA